jgi:hypothetical protein
MELRFTKRAGKFDELLLRRADGSSETIACPKQGIIPHDMVHFAVESEVAALGFLGAAAAGGSADFGTAADDPHARAVERLVETVQAEAWAGAPAADSDFIALYHVTCSARGDTPLALDAATLTAIRARLAALSAQWQALAVGDSLTLSLGVPKRG